MLFILTPGGFEDQFARWASARLPARCRPRPSRTWSGSLKDFAEPVWIFQLGEEPFPPLKTISNTNLPRPASSFVGRERETEIVALLRGGARLVTLTGPGGSGKTRLAIEAAAELVPEFQSGVF